ncbi:major capsid protein, partial [Klebsiella pneumoniae]
MLDIFNNDAFSVVSLTAKVNKMPFVPGQVGATGIFGEQGVTSKFIAVEEQNGVLALVAPSPRGGVGETTDNEKRKIRAFEIPHFQRDDAVMADEVQGVRGFGSDINNPDQALQTIEAVVAQKSAKHVRALDATLEHQRVGAVKGVVTDKFGNVMFDLFQLYQLVAPTPVEFNLDVDATKVRTVCFDVIDKIEDTLDGIPYSGIHAFVGNTFWKMLIEHKSVRETYLNTVQAAELRGS